MLCGCGNCGTVNRPFLGGMRNSAKKHGKAKNPFAQWVLRLPPACQLFCPVHHLTPSAPHPGFCSLSCLFLSTSALRLESFPLVVHFALFVTPMQGTSLHILLTSLLGVAFS